MTDISDDLATSYWEYARKSYKANANDINANDLAKELTQRRSVLNEVISKNKPIHGLTVEQAQKERTTINKIVDHHGQPKGFLKSGALTKRIKDIFGIRFIQSTRKGKTYSRRSPVKWTRQEIDFALQNSYMGPKKLEKSMSERFGRSFSASMISSKIRRLRKGKNE